MVRNYYQNADLHIPNLWNLGRKHFRVQVFDGRFVNLTSFRNRISERELKMFCVRLTPLHVYFSVLDWLLSERVRKKYKAKFAVLVGEKYVVNIARTCSRSALILNLVCSKL